MKILVFGSREWIFDGIIYRVLSKLPKDTILIHGAARGADTIAGRIGEQLGFDVRPYPVSKEEWDRLGGAAGPQRNARMIKEEHPDINGLLIDKGFGFSTEYPTAKKNKGTHNMSEQLWRAKIRFEIFFPQAA